MLDKLLIEIQASGTLQPPVLASRLNISVPMVEAMLEGLERMGKIRLLQPSCGETACSCCPLVNGCAATGDRGRVWMLSHQ
ncbi:MAG: FeoC-like transcriptional regulator [Anaerolineaceae bacterium]